MDPDKEPRADAKLQNLPEEELEVMWRFRNPEKGGKKLKMEAIAVQVPLRYGFTVSQSTLSNFYVWLKLRRRFQEKQRTIAQIKEELARDPDISEEQVEKAGRVMFMAEGILEKDAKVFGNMVKIGHGRVKLQQADVKLELSKEVVAMDQRKLALLERKAKALDEAAEQMRLLKAGGQLMPDQERTAILDKMDEILGLKK
jgi:hypothetical protein